MKNNGTPGRIRTSDSRIDSPLIESHNSNNVNEIGNNIEPGPAPATAVSAELDKILAAVEQSAFTQETKELISRPICAVGENI